MSSWSNYTSTILSTVDKESYYLSILENVERRGGTELKATCPFSSTRHQGGEDKNPSLTVNLSNGVYYCQTCQSKGNVHTMTKELNGWTKEETWLYLGDMLNLDRPDGSGSTRPEIDNGLVAQYHQALMKLTGPIRRVLSERRGLTDKTLVDFQLGWDGDRITIPIYDEFGTLSNIRKYKWNSDNDQYKVINYKDELGNTYGDVRLYGIENLLDDSCKEIVWCEGELDRIVAEQHGFKAACATAGAGTMRPEWIKLFRNKNVYLAQDNDEAGIKATSKLCKQLYKVCKVLVVKWPDGFPAKGDITDFFTKWQQGSKDFQALLDSAEEFIYNPTDTDEDFNDEELEETHLADATAASLVGKRTRIPVMVSGRGELPFVCPKTVICRCPEPGESKKCSTCEIPKYAGEMVHTFSTHEKGVLKLIQCTDSQQVKAIGEALKVRYDCPMFDHKIVDYYNVHEVRLIPKAQANFGFTRNAEYVTRVGYHFGDSLKANQRYSLFGHLFPDTQTQHATFLFDKAIPEKNLIADFELTEEVIENLKLFQLQDDQTISSKFDNIHADLEYNVTRVWERRKVAFAVDLVYHTAIQFNFQDQLVRRGWAEALIIGDSGQAKTTLVERLMQHYTLGEIYSGESSKRTGLIASMQQTGKGWFLVWGAFPLNDGGLITLDELSGLPEDTLASMSDVRSSGIAKATGVITSETDARTRVIFLSNPRNGRPLNTEAHGANAILKLFGKAEDVRRLDLAVAVASNEIDAELINRDISSIPVVTHKYTSAACKDRVLWAWSRKPDQIIFAPDATSKILKRATEMGRKYSSKVPLVEAADQRLKIARLSIACAACVVSTDETFEKVVVKPEHVDFVVDFLNSLYCDPSMGYDKLSAIEQEGSNDSDENLLQLRKQFMLLQVMDHNELAQSLYEMAYFDRNALEERTGLDQLEVKQILKYLLSNKLIMRTGAKKDYTRMPIGTKLFESMINKPITKAEVQEARRRIYAEAEI